MARKFSELREQIPKKRRRQTFLRFLYLCAKDKDLWNERIIGDVMEIAAPMAQLVIEMLSEEPSHCPICVRRLSKDWGGHCETCPLGEVLKILDKLEEKQLTWTGKEKTHSE